MNGIKKIGSILLFLWFTLAMGACQSNANEVRAGEDDNFYFVYEGSRFFYHNQINSYTSAVSLSVTESYIYISTAWSLKGINRLDVFSHSFEHLHTIDLFERLGGAFENSLVGVHVEDGIAYLTTRESHLYRYNLETDELERLSTNVADMVVIGDQIFHRSGFQRSHRSNLYVLDLTSGEREMLIEGDIWQFIITSEDSILFVRDSVLYQADLDGNNITPLNDRVWRFGYDGQRIVWSNTSGYLYSQEIGGAEITTFSGVAFFSSTPSVFDEHIVFSTPDGHIRLLNHADTEEFIEISRGRYFFAVLAPYIIYADNQTAHLYIVNVDGTRRLLRD